MRDSVRFTECMSGWLAEPHGPPGRDAYAHAASRGRASGGEGSFVLTVVTPDVPAFLADPLHRAPAYGCAFLPIHARPLRVVDGHLDLFVDSPRGGGAVLMRYGLLLADDDGVRWYLRGVKEVVRRAWWPTGTTDTTTLFVDLWRGDAPAGDPLLSGIFTMGPGGVAAQALSFRGRGAWLGLRGIARYLAYYARRVIRVYTGARGTSHVGDAW